MNCFMNWMIIAVLCALPLEARNVFTLGAVRLRFDESRTVQAELLYRGSGQVEGRWELLRPGEEQPEIIARFRSFLPPSGKLLLAGPEWSQLPHESSGTYSVLMRVERVTDKSGDADLRQTSVPVLRYWAGNGQLRMALIAPEDGGLMDAGAAVLHFTTGPVGIYRIEIADPLEHVVLRALVPPGATTYRLPPWIAGKLGGKGAMNWRLSSLKMDGEIEDATPWWFLALRKGFTNSSPLSGEAMPLLHQESEDTIPNNNSGGQRNGKTTRKSDMESQQQRP